jgi:glycosyltransferase involved in cell wall biosynthesis
MRVHVVDPSAYTPPYDHALCRSLGEAGADVKLITSHFDYGPVPSPRAYTRNELFYRHSHSSAGAGRRSRARLAVKLAEHIPGMLSYRRYAKTADVVHFQWLTVQPLDVHLLPRGRPLVLTAHDVLPREPRRGQLAAQKRLYERMDAVIVHSLHGQQRLIDELRLDPNLVHVIPHGVLKPWEDLPEQQLPENLREAKGPVVLFFGLLRPYKGLDLLLEAWREISGAELWIVGMPRMDISQMRSEAPAGVRFLTGYVPDAQILALMHRASFAVLPYREIDQSGVLFTALGAGTPLLLSDVGGFPEIASTGAARIFKSGDSDALRTAIEELLSSPDTLAQMSEQARMTSERDFSWAKTAEQTLALYERLRQR